MATKLWASMRYWCRGHRGWLLYSFIFVLLILILYFTLLVVFLIVRILLVEYHIVTKVAVVIAVVRLVPFLHLMPELGFHLLRYGFATFGANDKAK